LEVENNKMGMVEEGAKVESYYVKRPMWLPKGKETMPVIKTFTEEEARKLPEWGENFSEEEKEKFSMPEYGVPRSSRIGGLQEDAAKVSRIPIAVEEPKGTVYYYELNPTKGGKEGTKVDWEKDFGYTPSTPSLPKLPGWKLPEWHLPKIGFPDINVGMPKIGVGAKAGIGVVLLFIAGIIILLAIGYSGMGESAGRVGEKEYSRKRK
jgi:hypothetical protein